MPASAGNLAVLWRNTGFPELCYSGPRQQQRADLYVYPPHNGGFGNFISPDRAPVRKQN